ncbi:hypothetical protein P0082_11515 [Candidatus Haliotispira prima]|uniref:Uncharacterized protein n=1 Tax=Candidatus Haliotispira prima TaxID=3034016 RepID=A0ABY8MGI5_9SPIO|nr:hypothetical protein P0082_11515 [Candidatus Haliotispira prima]
MTDVDEGTETKFGVSASTTFVSATQALVSLTPSKSGAAAFLAVADTEIIPSVTAAETLLAYRKIDFSDTSAQIIQFALSISATQDATSGEVSGDALAVLQPSTAYKIVMYSSGNSTTLLRFTTLGHLAEGYAFGFPGTNSTNYTFDISARNFRTETDGKFQVPFVLSWVVNAGAFVSLLDTGTNTERAIGTAASARNTIVSEYAGLANAFGSSVRGVVFLHTPHSDAVGRYSMTFTNDAGKFLVISL